MLKFAHLTDLHIVAYGEDAIGYDTLDITQRALDHVADSFPEIEFLVITGDLANWGEPKAYDKLRPVLEAFNKPVHLLIGNHDHRENFFDVFGDWHPYEAPYAHYSHDIEDYRLIFADSTSVGTHGGAFCARRLAWMDEKIGTTNREVLLFMHHHPVAVGAPSFDAKGLQNWGAFHKLLAKHNKKIRHIFHGHCHAALQGHVAGISFSGIRSMTLQAHTDLKFERACRWYGAQHYAIAVVSANALVTHHTEFQHTGPFLFRDRQDFREFARICAQRGVTLPTSLPDMEAAE